MPRSAFLRIALVLVFALIIGLVLKSYVSHRQSAGNLLQAVDTLKQDNPTLHLMDSALVILNEAENNFRLYTAIYQRSYLQSFANQMATVSILLDSAGSPAPGKKPGQLDNLVKKKSEIADKIGQLKKSTDSMLARSLRDEMISRLLKSIPPYDPSKIRKEEVIRDTQRNDAAPIAKKGLFKRLGAAIANKKDTVQSQMVITVRTKDGKSMSEEDFEARQLRKVLADVDTYYKQILRKQLNSRMQINVDEHSLAGTNLHLLEDLKSLIQTTKSQVKQDEAISKSNADKAVNGSVGNMLLYVILFLIGIAVLIGLLFLAWYKNRQYERSLETEKEKALETARARSVFMTNMSHEIRTPLNSIVGFSQELGHTPLAEPQQDMVHAIQTSSDLLMQVVNDVLDFSKLESDYISIQKKPFLLYQAIAEVASAMRIQATTKQLGFQLFFDGNQQQYVLGDIFRLKQILMNLIGNAIKYTDKGNITLTATLKKQFDQRAILTVAVEDTGPGISAELLPKIFERYYQTKSARLSSKGTGLGLAITRRLVELHGGEITVTSDVGKGSRFTCTIPYEMVSTPQAATPGLKPAEQPAVQQMEGLYVLVADDQEMNLLLLKMLLTRWKCRFDMARDGEAAWQLFGTNQYDLVLLDLQMPKMSGIDVVERIRADKDLHKAAVPVLALTADITRDDEELFRKAGFNDWLLKPFREKDIYAIIVKHLVRENSPASYNAAITTSG